MNPEVALISAVCQRKDPALLFEDVDQLFVGWRDVWQYVKDYYSQYQAMPTASVLNQDHPEFSPVNATGEPEHYLDKLRESWLRNELNSMAVELNGELRQGGAASKALESAMRRVADLHKTTSPIRDLDVTDAEDAAREYELRRKRVEERGGVAGIPTGLQRWDDAYSTGLAGGHLITIIGWSGHGKSWTSTLLACKAWEMGYRPMVVSLEMSPETVRDRIYTVMGSGAFRNSDLTRGDVNIDQFERWSLENFKNRQEFVVVATESSDSVRPATVQAKIDEHKPDIVFLDYAQLFDDNRRTESMTVRMMNVSREFKRMATANDIPLVLLTQATMDNKSDVDTPPMIEQVAWSKAIQNDSDLAVAAHKYTDTDTFEIVSRKSRHGPDFALRINWDLNSGQYEIIDEVEEWTDEMDLAELVEVGGSDD